MRRSDGEPLAATAPVRRGVPVGDVASASVGAARPALAAERTELEVRLDQVYSLLMRRERLCEQMSEEIQQGARAASRITSHLADLSRGRAAPARPPAENDPRVAGLRGNLEAERAQLRQANRALAAARAELAVAQRQIEALQWVEAERVLLAERVSLLEAALAAKDVDLQRAGGGRPAAVRQTQTGLPGASPPRAERRGEAPGAASGSDTEERGRQRQRDRARLSARWRDLQRTYREAVAEFDELRARRARLLQPAGSAAEITNIDSLDRAAPAIGLTSVGAQQRPAPRAAVAARIDAVVHLDRDPELRQAVCEWAAERGVRYRAGVPAGRPSGQVNLLAVVNVLREDFDPWAALTSMAAPAGRVRSLLYAARDQRGRVLAESDVFPVPFDADACAKVLAATRPGLRRVLTVGEDLDAMSRLRELLGRSRCSTAVAFDPRQARELITMVRPEYVLIDLALPAGTGVDLLLSLWRKPGLTADFGLMWSAPAVAASLRSRATAMLGVRNFGGADLRAALAACATPRRSTMRHFDRRTPSQ